MLVDCRAIWIASSFFQKYVNVATRQQYSWALSSILKDKNFRKECENAGITKHLVTKSFESFKNKLVFSDDKTNFEALKVQYILDGISKSKYSPSSIFPFFLSHSKLKYPWLKSWGQLKEASDLSDPTEWYPAARAMTRSIIFHAGPTNSGKTHAALENFLAAKSGIYCCPLRLLAREVHSKSKLRKVPCNLITGEERDYSEKSHHVACTVEMANLTTAFDVAVIDEIQIIADLERGWAWTRALLGVCAKEIHVCGEPRAISIIGRLSKECGDDFKVLEYQRLTKLRVKKHAVGTFARLKPGDCLVCFKRKDIYDSVTKLKLEGKEAAVVYGKLPPSTKRREAQKFNSPDNDYDILVATDAVGMGLNLNIKRVVFNSLEKGVRDEKGQIINQQLTTPEALQIAGRAGRYGLQESGEVTTMYKKDIQFLHSLLLNTKEDILQARISPSLDHYIAFSKDMPSSNLYKVLTRFREMCTVNGDLYQLCSNRDTLALAEVLQRSKLSLKDSYRFALCPVNIDREIPVGFFISFAEQYARSEKVTYDYVAAMLSSYGTKIPLLPTSSRERIALLEDVHNALSAYLWLSLQFPLFFPDYKKIFQLRSSVENVITLSLQNVQNKPLLERYGKSPKKRKDKKRKYRLRI